MGAKYVTGNFEENGKKYRDSPEKNVIFRWGRIGNDRVARPGDIV